MEACKRRLCETESKEMTWDEKHIDTLIKKDLIHDDITAIEHSIWKHEGNLYLMECGYILPDRAFMSSTCPMCKWVKWLEDHCLTSTKIWDICHGMGIRSCALAEDGVCDGGNNCCNGLWRRLDTCKSINNEEAIIEFMKSRLKQLMKEKVEKGFKEFEFTIAIKTREDARTLWALLNASLASCAVQGEAIGLNVDEVNSIAKHSWWNWIDNKLIEKDRR